LTRSSDFSTYATILYPAYPNELQRPLLLALIQMLWDRSDPNGYAHHMTTDPLPNTPAHKVLLHEAFGDHQVANVATEIEARTIGASIHQPAIASGRSYEVTPYYGIPVIPSYPFDGSALIVWDSGADTPPTPNTAPSTGPDPHGDPRSSPDARTQKSEFLKVGGAVSASIRRRRAGCLDRPPPAAPHRRCDGAPASPLRYSARARAARLSPARRDQAGGGLSSPHLPRRDEGARGMGSRVRSLQPAAAGDIRSRVRLTRAGEAAPAARGAEYAAGRRGHPRSAYEAPRAAVDRSTRVIGAESKRRGCPRLPARQCRVSLLIWNDLSNVLVTFPFLSLWSGAG